MSPPSSRTRWSRLLAGSLLSAALLGCGDAPERPSEPAPGAETDASPAPTLADAGAEAATFRAALAAGAGRVRVVALVSPT